MDKLIITSTEIELKPLLKGAPRLTDWQGLTIYGLPDSQRVLVTGIGTASTLIELGKYLMINKPNEIIQVGFAGSFHAALAPGSVVEVVEDRFGDVGIDDNGRFIPLAVEFPSQSAFYEPIRVPSVTNLPGKCGVTVNTTSGSPAQIRKIKELWNPDIESMEGAAAMLFCKVHGIKCLQVRSISNFVEPRNKSNWFVEEASESLCNWLKSHLEMS